MAEKWKTVDSLTLLSVHLLLRPAHLVNTVTIQASPDLYGTRHCDKTLSLGFSRIPAHLTQTASS